MYPFEGTGWKKRQKAFGFVMIIVSLFIVIISVPFNVTLGGWSIVSTGLGGILFIVGLLYFLEVGL